MSEFIEILSKESKADIDRLVKQLDEVAQKVNVINKSFEQVKLPSQASKEINNTKQATQQLTKAQDKARKTAKQLEAQERKNQRERIKDLRLQKQREKAFDKYERQLQREQKRLERTEGLYNRVQRGVNKVTLQYQQLAIKKELNGRLTEEESIELGQLETKLNRYNTALKNVDARIGKHTRNVGNYKSGFDGLGFSVAQLTREMPAFANSAQTGFMAISNNIPMLVDEINKLKAANKQLAASGKPTNNIFKALGRSLFSFQSLISIGVTLLTVYGAELFEWARGMTEGEKATEKATEELKEQNKQLRENVRLRRQTLGEEQEFIQNPDRLRELVSTQEGLIELAARLNNLNVEGTDVLKDQNLTLEDRRQIGLNLIEIAKLENELRLERNKQTEIDAKRRKIIQDAEQGVISQELKKIKLRQLLNEVESFGLTTSINLQKQISKLKADNLALTQNQVTLELEGTEAANRAKVEEVNLLNARKQAIEGTVVFYEQMISKLKEQQNTLPLNSAAWQTLSKAIKDAEREMEAFKRAQEGTDIFSQGFKFAGDGLEEYIRKTKEARKNTEELVNYMKENLQRDIFEAEFSKLGDMLNINTDVLMNSFDVINDKAATTEQRIMAIADSVGEVVTGISQTMMQNELIRIDNMIQANDEYYNNLIQQAQGNQEQQEFLRQEQEAKRRELLRKRAEEQKKAAKLDIITNTAVAIIKTFANLGFPAGVPAAAVMAGLGAAQVALVESQPIPEFKDGVRNFEGGYAILGDGYKEEAVLGKDGKLKGISPDKPTLTHLDKGDSVIPSLDHSLAKSAILDSIAMNSNKFNQSERVQSQIEQYRNENRKLKKDLIKSLSKANFINQNNNKVDLDFPIKKLKYKGK